MPGQNFQELTLYDGTLHAETVTLSEVSDGASRSTVPQAGSVL